MTDFFETINPQWTLFLDRDGVINKKLDAAYVRSIDEFEFLPGVEESLAHLTNFFKYTIVITNQQGIGKGLMSESDLSDIHQHMMETIEARGGHIDAIIYCPVLAGHANNCRKPNIEMGLRALEAFPDIIFNQSVMVGDSVSDIEFAHNLEMASIYVGPRTKKIKVNADARLGGLYDLSMILKKLNG